MLTALINLNFHDLSKNINTHALHSFVDQYGGKTQVRGLWLDYFV